MYNVSMRKFTESSRFLHLRHSFAVTPSSLSLTDLTPCWARDVELPCPKYWPLVLATVIWSLDSSIAEGSHTEGEYKEGLRGEGVEESLTG